MQREKKPNALLNVFCFLLPFPVTFFLPALITLLVSFASLAFIDDPYGHTLAVAIPIAYIVFIALELVLAIVFVKRASSPRSKAAAQHLLISTEVIAIFFILLAVSILLPYVIS